MSDLWENIKKNLYETSEVIADKVDEYSRIGRIRIDLMNIKRRLVRRFTELGAMTFEQLEDDQKHDLRDDPDVRNLINEIKEIQKELAAKKQQLREDLPEDDSR